VALLAGARKRGARVVVITNSLASTNTVSVHSGYRRYRRALLEAGVELYEIKPNAISRRRRSGGGWFRSMGSGKAAGGESAGSSLHAKAFAFDRGTGFVGSYNLDPRSSRLNTEMGVIFECPPLAKRLPEESENDLAHTAYRVELDGNGLVWTTHEGDKKVRFTSEPEASLSRRIKVQVMSWLPIEWML
jgi:putative cardiolipin synthase